MKGIIFCYLNFHPQHNQTGDDLINLVKNQNKDLIAELEKTDYRMAFVATCEEACRVEKVDFDQPFPRFKPNFVDMAKEEEKEKEREKDRMQKEVTS